MGILTSGKRAKHRRFSYEPRFYDPEKEERMKRRMRIKSQVQRRKPAGLVFFLAFGMLAIWIYLTL